MVDKKVDELKSTEPVPLSDEQDSSEAVPAYSKGDSTPVKDTKSSAKGDDRTSSQSASAGARATEDNTETPPPRPARPLHPFLQAEKQLKEAFPDADPLVIRAVLVASGVQLESAFNGLLAMADSSFDPESIAVPVQPSGAAVGSAAASNPQDAQILEDERLARQLAQEYGQREPRTSRGSGRPEEYSSRRVWNSQRQQYEPSPERSFFDDDLPEIQRNLQKGFNETRDKVTSWMTNFKKRIDGEDAKTGPDGGRDLYGALGESDTSRTGAAGGPQGYGYNSARTRRAGGRPYYDRDPDEIGDDFRGINLRNNDTDELYAAPAPPPKPMRPGHAPAVSALGDPESATGKTSKWEPLKASETEKEEKDPFFIGESDDDDEESASKDKDTKDTKDAKKAS